MVEPFLIILRNNDLWNLIKSFMYPNQKSSTFENYRDGVAALTNGYVHLINNKVLQYNAHKWDITHKIISFGNIELVKATRSKTPIRFIRSDLEIAAKLGYLDIVRYFHINLKISPSKDSINGSAINGHLPVVRYLINNSNVGYSGDILDIIAKKGYLDILKLLFTRKKLKCTHRGLHSAVSNDDLEMVKFIVSKMGTKYTEYALTLSTNLEIIKLLEEHL